LAVQALGSGASVGAQTPPVQIQRQSYVGEDWQMHIVRERNPFCVGEVVSIEATARRYGVFEDASGRWQYVLRPPTPQRAASWHMELADPSIVAPGAPSLVAGDTLREVGKAKKAGDTTITFQYKEHGVVVVQTVVPIKVTDCNYEVHTFSIWHVNAGFNVVASATVDTVLKHVQGSLYRSAGAEQENVAVAFPLGGCKATYTVSAGPVDVTGFLDQQDGLLVAFTYGLVQSGVEVCHVPRVSGGTTGAGQSEQIQFLMNPRGGQTSKAHVLHIEGLGDFPGTTFITVVPIHV
jgi:hypothetical protein